MWNALPEYAVNAPSVDSFKNRLDKQWSNEEIVYQGIMFEKARRATNRSLNMTIWSLGTRERFML